jgi:hypothetical protein
MNSTFQPDSHPGAESLNAFAEQALPEREHSQVLAHLAACSRCRQVVFLAQQAASELEMHEAAASRPELDRPAANDFAAVMAAVPMPAAGAASGKMVEKRQNWWSDGWRLALVPAAALAAILGFMVFVHVQRARTGFESGGKLALNVPQAAPQTKAKPAELPPADKAAIEKPKPGAAPIAVKVPAEKVLAASASAPSQALLARAAPPAPAPFAPGAMEVSTTELSRARSLQQPQGHGSGMQLSNAAMVPQATPAAGAARPAVLVGGNSFNNTSVSAADKAQARPSVSASLMTPQSAMKTASAGSFISSQQTPEPKAAVVTAHKARITPLPGGLRAVSIVTARHRTLAIDSSGTVFLSEDSGSKWEPVARQWSGRAVAVRIQAGLKIDGAVTADAKVAGAEDESSKSLDTVAAPPAVFEIVNDSDLIWVSADGKTWKAK